MKSALFGLLFLIGIPPASTWPMVPDQEAPKSCEDIFDQQSDEIFSPDETASAIIQHGNQVALYKYSGSTKKHIGQFLFPDSRNIQKVAWRPDSKKLLVIPEQELVPTHIIAKVAADIRYGIIDIESATLDAFVSVLPLTKLNKKELKSVHSMATQALYRLTPIEFRFFHGKLGGVPLMFIDYLYIEDDIQWSPSGRHFMIPIAVYEFPKEFLFNADLKFEHVDKGPVFDSDLRSPTKEFTYVGVDPEIVVVNGLR